MSSGATAWLSGIAKWMQVDSLTSSTRYCSEFPRRDDYTLCNNRFTDTILIQVEAGDVLDTLVDLQGKRRFKEMQLRCELLAYGRERLLWMTVAVGLASS